MPTESDKNAFSLESGNLWSAITHPMMSNAENLKEAAKKTGKEVAKDGEEAMGGLGGWLQGLMGGMSKEGGFMGFLAGLFSMFIKPIMGMLGLGGNNEETAQAPQTPDAPQSPNAPAQNQEQDLAKTAISTGIHKTLAALDLPIPDGMRDMIVKTGTEHINTALSEISTPSTPNVKGFTPQTQKIPS